MNNEEKAEKIGVSNNPRVVITGSQGLIGKALGKALRDNGYDVVGIDVSRGPGDQVLKANLLDFEETQRAINAARPFSVLIHAAALAHGQAPPPGQSLLSVNSRMTENLINAVEKEKLRVVFLSSVSVYGEDAREGVVGVDEELRPSTDYGRSKKASEDIILESAVEHCDILRLAPVFDACYVVNARSRAFLPGLSRIKIWLLPSPKYSLCSLDTVVQKVCDLLGNPPCGRQILNVCDSRPYDQHEIASWFMGLTLPVPVVLLKPLYWSTFFFPAEIGYRVRCMYWKLFRSNVYSTAAVKTTNSSRSE